jgi:diadenosine tetraphosphate (Ap4A) HIT family hydrolase
MSIALPRSPLRTSTLISVYSPQSIRSLSHTTTITTPTSLILTPPKPGPPRQFVRMSSSSTPPSTTNPAPVRHKDQDKSKDKDTPGGKGRDGQERIFFGPFDVTTQVFLTTPYSFALVNLKPLLPGHVLVCTRRPHRRMTDMSLLEVADLFTSVQRVQRMLARFYFSDSSSGVCPATRGHGDVLDGSFNIALQDGPEAGQTVPHV